jgi:putative salt-induced outer membrane protein YdiY
MRTQSCQSLKVFFSAKSVSLFWFLLLGLVLTTPLAAQHDTLWVKNGNVLYGEIKGLRSGIIEMETPYSDDDFTIDYDEVEKLVLERRSLIVLLGGERLFGFLRSEEAGKITIYSTEGTRHGLDLREVTSIQVIKKHLWNRFSGYIDFGFNLTKANNQRQLNVDGGLSYTGYKWFMNTKVSSLFANQDGTDQIERTSVDVQVNRLISDNWYILASGSFLSNTEQDLVGRYSGKIGAGRFLAITDRLLWGVGTGINLNIESYEDESLNKESTELFISSRFNMFDVKDLSLDTNIDFYPSLSEKGRLRIDYNLNVKYDLPYDFYIKTSFQFNYDNQPPATASQFDYILTTGFGWKFN